MNYLNIHALISHNPSCLNRDSAGRHKSTVFGGVYRLRHSSQAIKRGMRTSDYFAREVGKISIRTNNLAALVDEYSQQLKEYSPELVQEVISLMVGKKIKPANKKETKKETETEKTEEKSGSGAIIPWCLEEVRLICKKVQPEANTKLDSQKIEKMFEKDDLVQELRKALGSAIDIALFGRMSTSKTGLLREVEASMSVSHALTTHEANIEQDWFTAMDDLAGSDSSAKAGHIDNQYYGSGVFYRYAVININQLQKNLGDISRPEALQIAAHMAYLISQTVLPAKQNAMASYERADYILTSFSNIPISFYNAFEKPISWNSSSGFMEPSIAAFEEYLKLGQESFLDEMKNAVFTVRGTNISPRLKTIRQLKSWIENDGDFQD